MASTATAVETTHPIPDGSTASPAPVPNGVVPSNGIYSGPADYVAIIEDLPAIMKAMHRGASAAVKARRLPYIRVGVRSLRCKPEDLSDHSRFTEDVTLSSSLIDDAVAAAIDELYRCPDEFLKKSLEDQKQEARELAMKHAWRLLDARKRSKEVRLEPPSDDDSTSGDDCPLTNMADDLTLKVTEYDPVLGKTTYHSVSHSSWQAVNEYEDRLIEMIDRRRSGLAAVEEPYQTAYERAVKVLGRDGADFMAEYEALRDTGRTKPASCADRKRYSRLKDRLGREISPDVTQIS
ncbi:MAG: hypothetical protein WCD02_19565 [Terriglobales bacterium]